MIAGYAYDGPFSTHQIGWGLGWVTETASLTYGMRIPVGDKLAVGDLMHRIAFRLKTGTEGRPSMDDF